MRNEDNYKNDYDHDADADDNDIDNDNDDDDNDNMMTMIMMLTGLMIMRKRTIECKNFECKKQEGY